jgi:hypothetical protein
MSAAAWFASLRVTPTDTVALEPSDLVDVVGFVRVHGRLRMTALVMLRADALTEQLAAGPVPSFVVHQAERPDSSMGLVDVYRDGEHLLRVTARLEVLEGDGSPSSTSVAA